MTAAHAYLVSFAEDAWGVRPEFLWADSPETSILRHPRTRKWFAAFQKVAKHKLGIPGDGSLEILNVKCDTDTLATLIGSEGFHPAYHMNKSHWLTVLLDGSVPDEMLSELTLTSYDLVG